MLLAGFDAGQTSTRCRISRWDGTHWISIGQGKGPGVVHLEATDGRQRFLDAIQRSSAEALGSNPCKALDAAVIGASGIDHGTSHEESASRLLAEALALSREQVLATGDERTALRGAFPDGAGIVLISGTGMVCLGRDGSGREHRCGGWGWRLDGGGSAFDLGHQGLQLTLEMADGRRPDNPLRQQLWTQLACRTAADVKARVVRTDCGTAEIAALAPAVVQAAENGLKPAQAILTKSATTLARCAGTVARTLDLVQPRLVGHGGTLEHLAGFREAVHRAIEEELPDVRWQKPAGDACQGALTMARELALRRR